MFFLQYLEDAPEVSIQVQMTVFHQSSHSWNVLDFSPLIFEALESPGK